MKTLRKISFATFLIGSMLLSALFTQGENPKTKTNNVDYYSNMPYISAGDDVSICQGGNFMTHGISTYQTGITIWKTSGDGVFENIFSLSTIYIPGEHDKKVGSVTLTLIYLPKALTISPPIHDDMVLNFGDCGVTGNENEM
jgi:hypothetical protein